MRDNLSEERDKMRRRGVSSDEGYRDSVEARRSGSGDRSNERDDDREDDLESRLNQLGEAHGRAQNSGRTRRAGWRKAAAQLLGCGSANATKWADFLVATWPPRSSSGGVQAWLPPSKSGGASAGECLLPMKLGKTG
jgi:hypothetical protein